MYIQNSEIIDLGLIKKLRLHLTDDRINVIQGANGSGKTTILSILYSFFQDKEELKYFCEDNLAYIKIQITDEEKKYQIMKCYNKGKAKIMVSSFEEMKKIALINRKKIYFVSGELFFNKNLSDEMLYNATELLQRLNIEDKHHIADYVNRNAKYRFVSGGIQQYIYILNILYQLPEGSILLLDEPFGHLDISTIEEILQVLQKIKNVQLILTSTRDICLNREFNKIELGVEGEYYKYGNSLKFDYKRIFKQSMKFSVDNNEGVPIVKYKLNADIGKEENRNIEFKEIKGNKPCNSIIDTSEIYINAFLNSRMVGSGTILWGVSDSGIIRGVTLSKEDKDVINRKISERIGQMKPYVSNDMVKISYEKIIDDNEIVDELYIVEIIVQQFNEDTLYATSKDEVYIKTDGGKKKLNVFEIQQELKRRLK